MDISFHGEAVPLILISLQQYFYNGVVQAPAKYAATLGAPNFEGNMTYTQYSTDASVKLFLWTSAKVRLFSTRIRCRIVCIL
jgi:hypothetical protein